VPLPEKALIEEVRRFARSRSTGNVRLGIGDDCAIIGIPPRHEALVTTDFSLEGVHFRRQWHPPESVGHRCLARGLSDIAAMGGTPIAAFLSLALPARLPQSWVDRFIKGLLSLAKRYSVALAGGDTAQSPAGVLADIIVMGSVPKGTAVIRSGARPGNAIYVTGALGGSAATLNLLRTKRKVVPSETDRHFYPRPRLEVGRYLREKHIATAMIDLSDGLSTDLAHICDESSVGAEVEMPRLPLASAGKPPTSVSVDLALHGGEDYELLFTAPAKTRVPSVISGVPITRIGTITKVRGLFTRDASRRTPLLVRGWEHFRRT